jgi:hypothetical protein
MTWLRRPPRILCCIAIVWFSFVIVTFSDAGVPFPIWVLISLSGLGLAGAWIFRISIAWFDGRWEQTRWIHQNWRWWFPTSALVVVGFVLAVSQPLLSIRVYLSAMALRESPAVLSNISSDDLSKEGRWVGLFHVKEFLQFGPELRFITNECGLVDTCGIVFSPDGPPPNRGEDSFSHLFGPWWHWYQSW